MPDPITDPSLFVPPAELITGSWTRAGIVFAIAAGILLGIQLTVFLVVGRATRNKPAAPGTQLKKHTRTAIALGAIFVAALIALPQAPVSAPDAETALSWIRAGLIAAITWAVIGCVSVVDDFIIAGHDTSVRDNLKARRIHTRARVLTRTAMILICVAGGAGVLMSFEPVRQVGAGLLASAGIAGLAVGFAARPTLGNLIAGLQIAITEPIRLDDAVIIEGEWGWIEEITATYVVIKIWDQRRLVVPLQKFIEEPFQNWTRKTAELIGTVTLHLDYTAPVAEIRAKLKEITEAHPLWDKRVCVLQVIDTTERTMTVRALISAGTSPECWDLRCDIREQIVAWLQSEMPGALPTIRAEIDQHAGQQGDQPGADQ